MNVGCKNETKKYIAGTDLVTFENGNSSALSSTIAECKLYRIFKRWKCKTSRSCLWIISSCSFIWILCMAHYSCTLYYTMLSQISGNLSMCLIECSIEITTKIKGKLCVTGPLWMESTIYWRILFTTGKYAESVSTQQHHHGPCKWLFGWLKSIFTYPCKHSPPLNAKFH